MLTPEQEAMEVWRDARDATFDAADDGYDRDQAAASVILAWVEKREAGLREENARLRYCLRFAIGFVSEPGEVATDAYRSKYNMARTLLADHRSAG
jgi:hypothetical protein